MWFNKLMVRFFMSLDVVLFNFIGTLYDLLIAISRTTILTQGDIAYFVTRIEILLGIFMLFKVSFSLITYIVNPDDFSDSGKGFGKLVRNSIVSLVLLVLVPYIFQLAFNLQMKILDDNILAKLLLGERIENEVMYVEEGSTTSETESILNTAGETMAFYVMIPFFSPNYSVEGLEECINMIDSDGNFSSECSEALKTAGMESPDLDNYIYGVENKSLGLTFRQNTGLATTKGTSSTDNNDNNNNDNETATNKKADEQFIISYQKPISTIAAVVVCLLLISFCMDVGVRSIKLSFLQLIYPIPVISYMDPKSGQDGMFYKWYKMCLSTFLSLFIRLLALYFGIYIISKVSDFGMYDIINGSQITNGWVKIFIIIGVLMFVKQLPKILESMGFKVDGDSKFNLNPLKKFEDEAFGGKRITGAVGGAAVGAMHGRGLRGAASGFMAGKGFREAAKGEADRANKLREARLNGSTFAGRMGARFSKYTGFGGASARLAKKDKDYEKQIQNYDDAIKTKENSISSDKDSTKRNDAFLSTVDSMKDKMSSALSANKFASAPEGSALRQIHDDYQEKKSRTSLAQAKLNNMDRSQYKTQEDYDTAMQAANNEFLAAKADEEKFLKKDAVEGIYNYAAQNGGRTGNIDIDNLLKTLHVNAGEAGIRQDISSMENLGKVVDNVSAANTDIKNRISGVEREIESLQREKSQVEQERFNTRDRKAKIDANKSAI